MMSNRCIASPVLLASVLTVLFCGIGRTEPLPRFSVMQFDGVTEFPRGSQFSVGENSNLTLPPETATRPVRLLLVADALNKEAWLLAKMSPWRLDLGVMDSEREFLWHQTNEGTKLFFERTRSRSKGSMWSAGVRSVLADAFAIPDSADVSSVVESISSACRNGLLNATADNIANGDLLERRIPSTDGTSLIVNHFRAGEIASAVSVQLLKEEGRSFEIVSTCFAKGRPVEIRRGTLRLSQMNSMPAEIEDSVRHVSSDSTLAADSVVSAKRSEQGGFGNIALGVFWFGSVAFLLAVLVLQFRTGGKKNVVSI